MSVGDFFAALYERYENADASYTVYGPNGGPFSVSPTIYRWENDVKGEKDIYFRLCPVWEPPPKGKRGDSTYTCALTFLWMDIDCGPHKSGKKYFPTKEEAIAWIKKCIPYTAIIDSGTGLHVYLVLSEPLYLGRNDKESFKRAYELSWKYQQWARDMCSYEIDSTHDLARVLRVPGTIHSGTGNPVKIIELTKTTMDVEVLESLPVTKKAPSSSLTTKTEDADWHFDPDYELDWGWMSQIFSNYTALGELWHGRKPPENDQSPSGWRFAMISMLSHAGMDKQDIVNVTLWWMLNVRKYHTDDCKINRPDVWQRELLKCEVESFEVNIDSIGELVEEGEREKQMGIIANLLGFEDPTALVGMSKMDVIAAESDGYTEIEETCIRLHVRSLKSEIVVVNLPEPLDRAKCQKAIWRRTGIAFPHYHGKQATIPNQKWRQAMEIGWLVAEEIEAMNTDASAQLLRFAISYVLGEPPAMTLEEARKTGRPFKDDGVWVVPTAELNQRVTALYPDLRSNRAMHRAVLGLKGLGIQKVGQMYKGVRMACLLIPEALAAEVNNG